ncbi:hypothetical protein [Piscinibacterium candidicorallinum]|uniref:Transmembrane protein n=1 Tax=Piscinibacterium candidicorallinum TaxID=1793872 RepID=A0ABV7GZW0_9BURK
MILDPELVQARRQASRAFWSLKLHAAPALVVILALFAPADALDRSALAREFCSWVVWLAPFLAVHAEQSYVPQVVTLVKCVSFAALPVVLAAAIPIWMKQIPVLLLLASDGQVDLSEQRAASRRWVSAVVVGVMFLLVFVFNWVFPAWSPSFETHRPEAGPWAHRVVLAIVEYAMLIMVSSLTGMVAAYEGAKAEWRKRASRSS